MSGGSVGRAKSFLRKLASPTGGEVGRLGSGLVLGSSEFHRREPLRRLLLSSLFIFYFFIIFLTLSFGNNFAPSAGGTTSRATARSLLYSRAYDNTVYLVDVVLLG